MNARTAVAWVGGIALATTLTLPGRQTAPAINALTGFFRGVLSTAMGTGKRV